ncbi:MAG: SDR family NAD(P)-dependent oxidoreductase [Candidatus Cloacimonetes bacterium]|nr:SDR family NAD(P)-dependent oxidoreductase [Candidatus Cloacimonadota bacterium]
MKLILITGANSQIGSFLAKAYRAEGYQLLLLYHNRNDRLREFVSDAGCLLQPVDLGDPLAITTALDKSKKHFGCYPSSLIHCAAIRSSDAMPIEKTEPALFTKVFNTNVMSAYNVLQCIIPFMKENCQGRIVLFGSSVTRSGLKNGSAYAASKAAITNIVKSVAIEVAPYGILINAISPAPVETELEEDYSGEYLDFRKAYFKAHKESAPTGKLVTKQEIKLVVDMLISDVLQNLTGEEILLTGGIL